MSSAPQGLAPREGLGSVLMKMGRAGAPFEPRRRPQAGKSGDPRSQNADSGATMTGGLVRYLLRSWNALSASSVHSKGPFFFISWKKGSARSPSLEMKRP